VLRLLLDEHLSENIATSSRSLAADIIIASMVSWEEGAFQGQEDDVLLKAAHARGWTLVTWDQRTIAPLLQMICVRWPRVLHFSLSSMLHQDRRSGAMASRSEFTS